MTTTWAVLKRPQTVGCGGAGGAVFLRVGGREFLVWYTLCFYQYYQYREIVVFDVSALSCSADVRCDLRLFPSGAPGFNRVWLSAWAR